MSLSFLSFFRQRDTVEGLHRVSAVPALAAANPLTADRAGPALDVIAFDGRAVDELGRVLYKVIDSLINRAEDFLRRFRFPAVERLRQSVRPELFSPRIDGLRNALAGDGRLTEAGYSLSGRGA